MSDDTMEQLGTHHNSHHGDDDERLSSRSSSPPLSPHEQPTTPKVMTVDEAQAQSEHKDVFQDIGDDGGPSDPVKEKRRKEMVATEAAPTKSEQDRTHEVEVENPNQDADGDLFMTDTVNDRPRRASPVLSQPTGQVKPTSVVLNTNLVPIEPFGRCLVNCYSDGFQVYQLNSSSPSESTQLASIITPYAVTKAASFPSNSALSSPLGIEAMQALVSMGKPDHEDEAIKKISAEQPLLLIASCPPEGNENVNSKASTRTCSHASLLMLWIPVLSSIASSGADKSQGQKTKNACTPEVAEIHTFRSTDVRVFSIKSNNLPIFPNSGTFSHPVSLNSRWMAAPATTSTLKAMSGDRSEITGDYASRQAHGATKNIVSGLQSLKKSGKKYFREAAPELKHGVQDAANIASNMFSLAAGAVADFTTTVGGYMNAKPTEGSTQLSSTTSAADYLLHANKYSGSKEPSTEDDQKEVSGHQQKASRRSTLSSTRTHQNKQESCSSEEAGSPGFVIVVDLVTRSTVCLFRAHSTRVADTKFNNDGSLLATANERGQAIKIFSLTWPKQTVMSRDSSFIRTSKIRSQSEPFHSRHHSGDQGSMSALSGNVDKATNLKHNVSLLYILERGWTSVRILDIAFSPDSKLVVAVSSNGTCHCYRIEPNGGSLAVPMRFPSRQELCSALNTVDKVHGIARRPKENMDERISQLYTHSCNRIQSLSSSRISHRNADARIRLDLKGWKHEAKAKRRERERIQRCVVEQELAKRDAVYERQIKSNTMSGSSCEFSTLTYVADMEPYLRMDSTLNQVGADVRPQSLWLDDGGVADHEKPIYCDVMLICESSRPPPKLPPWGQRDDYVDEICRSLQSGYNEVNASDRKYKMLVGGPDGMAHVYSIDVTTGITEKAKQNALALLHPYFDNPAMDILDLSDESSPQEKLSVSGGEVTSAELLNKYESGRQSATGADILAQYSVPYNENKEIDISSVSLRASPKNGLSPKRGRSLSETLDRRSSSSTSGGDNQTSYTAWYSKLSSYLGQALSSASRFANISNPTDTCANLEEATGVHKYEGFPQALPHGIAVLLNVLRDSDCTACIQTSGMTVLDLRRKVSDEIQYFTEHTQEHRRDKTGNDICPPRLMLYSSEYTTSHSEAMCKWSRYSNDETHTLRILKENCNQFPTSEEDSSMVGSHPSDRNPPVSVSSTASGCVSITTRSSNNSPASDGLCSITEDVIMETGKSHNRDSWEDSYQTALTMDTVDDSPTVETSSRSSPVTSRDDSPNVFVGRSASASNASYDNKQGTGKSDPDFFSATEGSNRSSFDSTNQLDSAVTEVATSMNKDESVVVNSACTSEGQNETGDHESNHGGSQSSRKSRKKGKSKRSKKKR